MKKIIGIVIMLGTLGVFTTACYDQFRLDFDYTTVAFSNEDGGSNLDGVLYRTAVREEDQDIKVGIYVGGLLENNQDRLVNFEIDPSLLGGTGFTLLPDNYYSISDNSQFRIPAGSFIGSVEIDLTEDFFNDPAALNPTYAIPFRLTGSPDADSVRNPTKIVVFRYVLKEEGFYNQQASYVTSDGGTEISSGTIENVINFSTTGTETLLSDGMLFRGPLYTMQITVNDDNTVDSEYIPGVLQVENMARAYPGELTLATSAVSPWESLEGINTGNADPESSFETPRYGNWPDGGQWQWVEYTFDQPIIMYSAEIYWGTDGGGLQPPTDAYYEIWDDENEVWVQLSEAVGLDLDQFNVTEFDEPIVTSRIRANFTIENGGTIGTSIVEWRVNGLVIPTEPEQSTIADIIDNGSTYDPTTGNISLRYTISYDGATFTTSVESELEWRNRVRDGVNEWYRNIEYDE